jgi:hypothetical protein
MTKIKLEWSDLMNTARKILHKLVDEIPENHIAEVVDFITFLKLKKENLVFKELEAASQSSVEFWNNDIDDEVWNDV